MRQRKAKVYSNERQLCAAIEGKSVQQQRANVTGGTDPASRPKISPALLYTLAQISILLQLLWGVVSLQQRAHTARLMLGGHAKDVVCWQLPAATSSTTPLAWLLVRDQQDRAVNTGHAVDWCRATAAHSAKAYAWEH